MNNENLEKVVQAIRVELFSEYNLYFADDFTI